MSDSRAPNIWSMVAGGVSGVLIFFISFIFVSSLNPYIWAIWTNAFPEAMGAAARRHEFFSNIGVVLEFVGCVWLGGKTYKAFVMRKKDVSNAAEQVMPSDRDWTE